MEHYSELPFELKLLIIEMEPSILKSLTEADPDIANYVDSIAGQNWINRTLRTRVDTPTEKGYMLGDVKHGEWEYYRIEKGENIENGIWVPYEENRLFKIENYSHGKLNGDVTEFNHRFNEKTITPYIDDKKNGIQKQYRNEDLQLESVYVNDLLEGNQITYYPNLEGHYTITSYINGKKNGIQRIYYNGYIGTEKVYVDDLLEGNIIIYNPDSESIRFTRPYVKGVLQGIENRFNPDGTIRQIVDWKNGHGVIVFYANT